MSLEEMQILRENLTSEQLNAVLDKSRNILCLACAGSGKSRTLAYKIAYLVSQGESPESIIAFTFTEKAADSIKRRVAEALKKMGLPENYIGAMFIGTLDSFCQKLLGDIDASYRQFDVLDLNGLILFIMSRGYPLGVEYGEGYFNRITNLANSWQTANNENISLEAICNCEPQLGNQLKNLEKTLRGNGYMDFSYAIRLAAEELKKFKTKENTSIEKYKYLFVDEYQDINPIQEEFIKTLSEFLEMLFVVGDDDQSIYGWRGANVQNILTFEKRYSNVPGIMSSYGGRILKEFIKELENSEGDPTQQYHLIYRIVNAADYGVPQLRKRFVLHGVRGDIYQELKKIELELTMPAATHNKDGKDGKQNWITVREAFNGLPKIEPGARYNDDKIKNHYCAKLSEKNLKRMQIIRANGGSRSALPPDLILRCHQKYSGHSDVYGIMNPDQPSPTITGGCLSYSKGRFGHPFENRAISVREAARLQTFPDDYIFGENLTKAALEIGNAVPIKLVEASGKVFISLIKKLSATNKKKRK